MDDEKSGDAFGKGEDVFELHDTEHVLNLEFYLHRSILKWQDALESALRQGKDIETGLINRGLAGDMVEGVAKARNIIHWEKETVPEGDGKQRDKIIQNNEEAEAFKKKYDEFEKQIEKLEISNEVKRVKKSDFKVFEVLKKISVSSTKHGTVIV